MSHRSFAVAAALTAAAIPALAAGRTSDAKARPASTQVVRLGEYFFRPKRLTIHVGDRVRFVNVGRIQHTVADSTAGGTVRSRVIHPRPLSRGASQTVTFRKAGTIHYVCTFHPTLMRGTIVVRR